ncbi:hypothetical protein K1T35_06575 [Pseudonocardia sp. DSM 110487]|uniref:hypothetical protein n=1 Tax=Pseudonocardia sp. DSM 110487 TaxID=2865833 RepID=UPI001C6A689F|nr:hypothetical protein [Pseudonocardia sp. DSM 110487]QYN36925.1 hypothetical protein K1T35_06575 [Pseudonocardia sp. DSM 110487]
MSAARIALLDSRDEVPRQCWSLPSRKIRSEMAGRNPVAKAAVSASSALTARRRLAWTYERHPATSEAVIQRVAINAITRRLAGGRDTIRRLKRTFTTAG